MFTPEFIKEESGEWVLVANHSLENAEAIRLSIEFNRARIAYGRGHLPPNMVNCVVIYDVRGQNLSEATLSHVKKSLEAYCEVRIMQ